MLYGTRYLTPRARAFELDKFVDEDLKGLDLEETLQWYREFETWSNDPADRAFLAANDRYYLFTHLLHRKEPGALHPWIFDRFREVEAKPDGCLDLWARYHYKDQDVKTPILTTSGWSTHGALVAGDYVFSPSGKPVRVVATKHFTDSACYRVTFDNGVFVDCGAGHLWTVEVSSRQRIKGTANGRVPRKTVTIETSELARIKSTWRPVVKGSLPLQLPNADLPIDPYVLGAWLGDGTSSSGGICGQDYEVFEQIEQRGYVLSHSHCPQRAPFKVMTVYGLRGKLRKLGVLNNKYIPQSYLMASAKQRLELLQGLIDTDGSASPDNGCITFAQKNKAIAEGVQFLANSLGFKARLTPARTTDSWQVVFQASQDQRPCTMKKKLAALPPRTRRIGSQGWRVHSVEPIATVPTNCIQVDADDGLYLCGKELIATHNSSCITFAGSIQEIIRDPEITICIFSFTQPIAAKFLQQIKGELERNEDLKQCCPDVFWLKPKIDSPNWSIGGGITCIRTGNPKEATIEAHGLDSQPTSKHFKLLIYNDVVTPKNVTNSAQVEKTTQNWELSDNLGVGELTRKWHEGTRYDLADTYSQLIERDIFGLNVRLYPATHNGRLDGRPVFFTQTHWDEVKKTQKRTVAAQMLQNPAAGGDQMFEMEWLLGYEIRPGRLNVYIMVDPASSMKKESDRTAMAVIGVDERGNKWFLDGFCHKMSLLDRWKNLVTLHKKWSNMPSIEIIEVGYEKYGAQADIEAIQHRMTDFGYEFPIKELNWSKNSEQSKRDRVGRLQPDIEGSEYKFFFPCVIWKPHMGDGQGGLCFWHYNTDKHEFIYSPAEKITQIVDDEGNERYHWTGEPILTRAQAGVTRMGEPFRVAKPIVRRDEEGNRYDVTQMFFDELRVFPKRRGKDDLIDAASRLYDMEYTMPMQQNDKNKIEAAGPAH